MSKDQRKQEAPDPTEAEGDRPGLRRRQLVLRLSVLGLAGGAAAGCVPPPGAGPVVAVPPGRAYTGLTDADPSDG
ncbi:MAG: hypothetical protein RMK64_06935, partial [Rhodovarius sp.]|nr:hypothetical protein [Rhodovarius sp.]